MLCLTEETMGTCTKPERLRRTEGKQVIPSLDNINVFIFICADENDLYTVASVNV